MKICIFIGLNIGGAIGWALGERYGVMTAFILSGIGSLFGVYGGWRAARHFLE